MTNQIEAQMLKHYHNVVVLRCYANNHYDTGGHWVAECWYAADYEQLLYRCKNDLDVAKLELRAHWERIQEQEAETRWE